MSAEEALNQHTIKIQTNVSLRYRGGATDFLPILRRRKDTKSILPNKHRTYAFFRKLTDQLNDTYEILDGFSEWREDAGSTEASAIPYRPSLTFSTTNVTSSSWGRPFDHSSPTRTKCSIISRGARRAVTAKASFAAA